MGDKIGSYKRESGRFKINISHSDFQTQVQVWIKVCDGAHQWGTMAQY